MVFQLGQIGRDPFDGRLAFPLSRLVLVLAGFARVLSGFVSRGMVEGHPLAEAAVFWAVWALAAAGFAFSSIDAARYLRTGDAGRVLLKIPEPLRRTLAPLVRTSLGRAGLAFGGFAAGVIIALVEGVCTGQMLLPTIQYMASTPGLRARGALYLLVYNALSQCSRAVQGVNGPLFRQGSRYLRARVRLCAELRTHRPSLAPAAPWVEEGSSVSTRTQSYECACSAPAGADGPSAGR